MKKTFAALVVLLGGFSASASKVTCVASCKIAGKHFYFSFNRIDAASYRAGMERCERMSGTTEVMPVPAGSSTEMACFSYINQSVNLKSEDDTKWLAENEITKQCVDRNNSGGDTRGYEWTRGYVTSMSCK